MRPKSLILFDWSKTSSPILIINYPHGLLRAYGIGSKVACSRS